MKSLNEIRDELALKYQGRDSSIMKAPFTAGWDACLAELQNLARSSFKPHEFEAVLAARDAEIEQLKAKLGAAIDAIEHLGKGSDSELLADFAIKTIEELRK